MTLTRPVTMMLDIATPQPSDEPTFTDDPDVVMNVDPLGGLTELASPQTITPDEQPAKKSLSLVSHGNFPQNNVAAAV